MSVHKKNPTHPGKTAMAPYNFVPLPNRIFDVANDPRFEVRIGSETRKVWECHDMWAPGLRNGYIDVELETTTPLFIRDAVKRGDGGVWDQRESRIRPESAQRNGVPIIPGSSFRGLLRNLVEILSFSKIQPVTQRKPFYRSVGDSRYRNLLVKSQQPPAGGFIRKQREQWGIEPAEVVRIPHSLTIGTSTLKVVLGYRAEADYNPPASYQHRQCWIQSAGNLVTSIAFAPPPGGAWREGVLVLTGGIQSKLHEFVFVRRVIPAGRQAALLTIPEECWRRFHDGEQITAWQESTFPRSASRKKAGGASDGEPVFYIASPGRSNEVQAFGRARMFRFPHDSGPSECIPKELRDAKLDLSEILFGSVAGETMIRGRLRVSDLHAKERPAASYYEEVIVPQILGSPKPTCFPHYLVQDGTRPQTLKTYFLSDRAEIRGHKLYWQRWNESRLDRVKKESNQESTHDEILAALGNGNKEQHKQYTVIQPVRDGVTFSGRISFENLTDVELGAILTALQLVPDARPALGMAKPLGLGRVQVRKCDLTLIDRQTRYTSWSEKGEARGDTAAFRSAFSKVVVSHARSSQERFVNRVGDLWSIARLDTLRVLLTQQLAVEKTRYLKVTGGDTGRFGREDEYRAKFVLPTPHFVAGLADPWLENGAAEVIPGNTIEATLLDERTERGGAKLFIAETNQKAVLHPASPALPAEAAAGARFSFKVRSAGNTPQLEYLNPTRPRSELPRSNKGRGRR